MVNVWSSMANEQALARRRAQSFVSWPNPFIVLLNLVWRGCVGENVGLALSRMLSYQSYFVQVIMMILAAGVCAALLYRAALAVSGLLMRCCSTQWGREEKKMRVYETRRTEMQQQREGQRGSGFLHHLTCRQ